MLGVLANYLRLDDPDRAPDAQFARGARAAEGRRRAWWRLCVAARAARALVVQFALRRTRQLAGLRETPKYYLVRLLGAGPRASCGQGRAPSSPAGGLLTAAEDVYFLTCASCAARCAARTCARRAPAARGVRARAAAPARAAILLSDGTEPEALAAAAGRWRPGGHARFGRHVTGPPRVVLDPSGAHLEPGEILVAPSTDPGWTPLFLTAGGLVMEMGGANSHGAVVAREYGMPAVVGVRDAVARLQDAATARVDGTAGTVEAM